MQKRTCRLRIVHLIYCFLFVVLESTFRYNEYVGRALKDAEETVESNSLPQCLSKCQHDPDCQQAGNWFNLILLEQRVHVYM